jgi:ribosomal protein S12 methylthiotransferase
MTQDKRFLPYFDIPFQHSSPDILPAINRRGTAESYIALADTIRKRLPDAVIRTTFLTGFPGETEADFASLSDFQKKLNPDWLGCFTFSPEEGTPAFSMKKKVPRKTAALRKREIEERQVQITEKNMNRFAGRELNILLEERFPDNAVAPAEDESSGEISGESLWLGRLYCHAPEVDGAAVAVGETERKAGEIVPCRVIARRGIDLEVVFS